MVDIPSAGAQIGRLVDGKEAGWRRQEGTKDTKRTKRAERGRCSMGRERCEGPGEKEKAGRADEKVIVERALTLVPFIQSRALSVLLAIVAVPQTRIPESSLSVAWKRERVKQAVTLTESLGRGRKHDSGRDEQRSVTLDDHERLSDPFARRRDLCPSLSPSGLWYASSGAGTGGRQDANLAGRWELETPGRETRGAGAQAAGRLRVKVAG